MTITSISFLLFLFVVIITYYVIPWKKYQWCWLLFASCYFYLQTGTKNIVYILFTAFTTYLAAIWMQQLKGKQQHFFTVHKATLSKEDKKRLKQACNLKRRCIMIITMIMNFSVLCTFKYLNFLLAQITTLRNLFIQKEALSPSVELLVPLGISFYTFQTMGYLADVYWEKTDAEHNFGKVLLFTSFFPQITQGPISRYEQLSKELFKEHFFSYRNYSYGCQRMIWGFYKKMVIADLLAPIIREYFANYSNYPGISVLLGAFLYSIQIYADFSGYMDIVCGFCETLNIRMTENFERPYFSKSIAEYWRRWHISLGAWFKTYIYYPIAVSKWNHSLGKKLGNKLGTMVSKTMPASIALVVTWLTTGLWHGASWSYIVWGLVNGFFIIFSLWMEPFYEQIKIKLKINQEKQGWKIFQVLRTFILITFIKVLPEVGTINDGIGFWKHIFTNHTIPLSFTEIIPTCTGISDLLNIFVIIVGICLIFITSMLQRRQSVRDQIAHLPTIIRWAIYTILVLFILVFGTGSAKENFMYAQF